MTINEALALCAPLINEVSAEEYAAQTGDQMLWIEGSIMAPAGVDHSINSQFGEAVCNRIEAALDLINAA